MTGIEPAFSAWEADVLPLNYIRDASVKIPDRPASRHGGAGAVRAGDVSDVICRLGRLVTYRPVP
ncbi:MAG: hypothetical protein RL531_21 [Actinomycetota bacterium]